MAGYTVASLGRWSVASRTLPVASKIKSLHLYDFDNTLFHTPLANPKLWTVQTMGLLHTEDFFAGGGWWHDNHVLEATGLGMEKEEPRSWEGWWNENIVRLVRLSMEQDDALTVLLTGRGDIRFGNTLIRMLKSINLEFDLICLKPKLGPNGQRFSSTVVFKQVFMEDLIYTYRDAEEIRIYEDRPKHVTGFKDFLEKLNKRLANGDTPVRRSTVAAEVIPVAPESKNLNPVAEVAEVQRMINAHNLAVQNKETSTRATRLQIKKTVFFTGYMINASDTEKLQDLLRLSPPMGPEVDLKLLATNILITPRPATESILAKVGGMGAKQIWQVNAIGCYQNSVWALRCHPIPHSAKPYTESNGPFIVLAHRRQGARPADANRITQWQPVPTTEQLVFETTVGEKVQLRVEKEVEGENEFESLFARERPLNFGANKRKHDDNHENRSRGGNAHEERRGNRHRGGTRDRGGASGGRPYPTRDRRDRESGGGRGGRGNDRGGSGRAKGRGGYKSLDDIGGTAPGYQGHRSNYEEGSGRGRPHFDYDNGGYGGGGGARSGGMDGAYDDLMY